MIKRPTNYQTGLTLVEALVAITVLVVGVLGPLNIAARGIGDGIFARNQIAANYLAQEALEVVINQRYTNARVRQYAPSTDWLHDIPQDCQGGAGPGANFCKVDAVTSAIITTCASKLDPACGLAYDTTTGLYQVSGATPIGPLFYRVVSIVPIQPAPNTKEIKVTVTVSWKNKDIDKSLEIVEYLYEQG